MSSPSDALPPPKRKIMPTWAPWEPLVFLDAHPFVREIALDRLYGCIIGSALGDTIGLYTEFMTKAESEKIYPSKKFQLVEPATELYPDDHRSPPWALALVNSIVSSPHFVAFPVEIATQQWIESKRWAAPNGSLMRTHPIGVIGVKMSEKECWQLSAEIGRTTHVDPRCVVSCCIEVALVRGLIRGEVLNEKDVNACIERSHDWVKSKPELMNPSLYETLDEEQIETPLNREEFERHVYAETLEDLELDDGKMGYVYKCIGSALLLLRLAMREPTMSVAGGPLAHETLFEDLVVDLIVEGGDADTNGAAAGALLGAYLGYTKLPSHWTLGLAHKEWLMSKTTRLAIAVGVKGGRLEIEQDE